MDDVEKMARALCYVRGGDTEAFSDYFGKWRFWQSEAQAALDAIAAFRQPPTSDVGGVARRTVKVRVAVAVGKDGSWGSGGWTDASDEDAAGSIPAEPGDVLYFLTADLPTPEDVTVQATVEEG